MRKDLLTWLTLPYGKCSTQTYASGRPCFITCTYISDAAVQVLRAELAAEQAAGMPGMRLQRLQGWLQPQAPQGASAAPDRQLFRQLYSRVQMLQLRMRTILRTCNLPSWASLMRHG